MAQSKIATFNTLDKINQTFKYLKELDLQENLFGSWEDVFRVLDELKTLKIINIRYILQGYEVAC